MAVRDASRMRKAYSYYRPRPRPQLDLSTADTMRLLEEVSRLASLSTVTIVWNETLAGPTNDSNTVFQLQYTPIADAEVLLFVNGVLQHRNNGSSKDYTISGKTVTLNFAPHTGDEVTATYAYDTTAP